MARTLIIIVIIAALLLGVAACAGTLLESGTHNTARTSCVGLINVGSCNITQSRDTDNSNTGLLMVGAVGVGCLLLGLAWPAPRE